METRTTVAEGNWSPGKFNQRPGVCLPQSRGANSPSNRRRPEGVTVSPLRPRRPRPHGLRPLRPRPAEGIRLLSLQPHPSLCPSSIRVLPALGDDITQLSLRPFRFSAPLTGGTLVRRRHSGRAGAAGTCRGGRAAPRRSCAAAVAMSCPVTCAAWVRCGVAKETPDKVRAGGGRLRDPRPPSPAVPRCPHTPRSVSAPQVQLGEEELNRLIEEARDRLG